MAGSVNESALLKEQTSGKCPRHEADDKNCQPDDRLRRVTKGAFLCAPPCLSHLFTDNKGFTGVSLVTLGST